MVTTPPRSWCDDEDVGADDVACLDDLIRVCQKVVENQDEDMNGSDQDTVGEGTKRVRMKETKQATQENPRVKRIKREIQC